MYEKWLEENGVLTRAQMDEVRARWETQLAEAAREVRNEPQPSPESIWEHIFAEKK
jgi:2-oxoisovalerate dehydrogenase E1 component alpha subunit